MLFYCYFYQQIAIEITLFTEFYRIPITDTFRNHNLLFYIFILNAIASTTGAVIFYFSTLPIAWGTCRLHNKHALSHSLGASSAACVTFLRICSRFAFVSLTRFACYSSWILNTLKIIEKALYSYPKRFRWSQSSYSLHWPDFLFMRIFYFLFLRLRTFHWEYLKTRRLQIRLALPSLLGSL